MCLHGVESGKVWQGDIKGTGARIVLKKLQLQRRLRLGLGVEVWYIYLKRCISDSGVKIEVRGKNE